MASEHTEVESSGSRARPPKPVTLAVMAIIVAIIFILAFVLVSLDKPQRTNHGPIIFRKIAIPFGFKIPLGAASKTTYWTDITFQLSAGTYTVSWSNLTTEDLNKGQTNETWNYGRPQLLGTMKLWFNVTDLAGDGRLSNGDFITFTTGSDVQFSPSTTYTLTLLYEPTDGSMLTYDFTG